MTVSNTVPYWQPKCSCAIVHCTQAWDVLGLGLPAAQPKSAPAPGLRALSLVGHINTWGFGGVVFVFNHSQRQEIRPGDAISCPRLTRLRFRVGSSPGDGHVFLLAPPSAWSGEAGAPSSVALAPSTSTRMYGFTVLVPFQRPTPSHSGNRAGPPVPCSMVLKYTLNSSKPKP